MWSFFTFAGLVLTGLGLLAGFRLLLPLRLGPWPTALLWGALQLLSLLPMLVLALRRAWHPARPLELMAAAGWVVIGWLSVVFVLVVARDLILLAVRLTGGVQAWAAGSPAQWAAAGRQLLDGRTAALLLAGAATLYTAWSVSAAYRMTRVQRVEVPVAGLHPDLDGLSIAQLSDLHIGPSIRRRHIEAVARVTQELGADLIVLTGDLADGRPADLAPHAAPLAALTAPLGKWFVTGNHEYYSDPEGWLRAARELGFGTLVNQHVLLGRGAGRLLLAGVPDISGGRFLRSHEHHPDLAVAGAPEADFRLLLAHQPASVFGAAKAGFDLMLSGHTHGGQFHPWTWVAGKANPYLEGLNRHDARLQVYVSQGTGFWGPPMRFGAPAEITLLTLRRVDAAKE
jgi:hypothetical protein